MQQPSSFTFRSLCGWGCFWLSAAVLHLGHLLVWGLIAKPKGHNPWISPGYPQSPQVIFTLYLGWTGVGIAIWLASLALLRRQADSESTGDSTDVKRSIQPLWIVTSIVIVLPLAIEAALAVTDFREWTAACQLQRAQIAQWQLHDSTHLQQDFMSGHILVFDEGRGAYTYSTADWSKLATWDLLEGRQVSELQLPFGPQFAQAQFHARPGALKAVPPDINTIDYMQDLACSDDGKILLALVHTGKRRRLVELSPFGQVLRDVGALAIEDNAMPTRFAFPRLLDHGKRVWLSEYTQGDAPRLRLTLWDVESGKLLQEVFSVQTNWLALSPDGRWLAILNQTRELVEADIPVYEEGAKPGTAPARIMKGSAWGDVRRVVILDALTGETVGRADVGKSTAPLAIANDGQTIATATGTNRQIQIGTLTKSGSIDPKHVLPHNDTIQVLQFDSAGSRIAALSYLDQRWEPKSPPIKGTFTVWSLVDGKCILSQDSAIQNTLFADSQRITPDLRLYIRIGDNTLLRYATGTGKELLKEEPLR